VPLSFEPGEAYQFDWSYEVVWINSTTATIKVAHVRLCHSRMFFVRAGLRGRFFNVVDLANKLESEPRDGKQGRMADYLSRLDFVLLDELG
jgi:IstB-like ATP binding protein